MHATTKVDRKQDFSIFSHIFLTQLILADEAIMLCCNLVRDHKNVVVSFSCV